MKTFLLGLLAGLLIFPLVGDVVETVNEFYPNPILSKLEDKMIVPRYGFLYGVSGKCTAEVGTNGHGWKFVTRDYYKCGKLNILISDLIYDSKQEQK